jgi:hypothetical protein
MEEIYGVHRRTSSRNNTPHPRIKKIACFNGSKTEKKRTTEKKTRPTYFSLRIAKKNETSRRMSTLVHWPGKKNSTCGRQELHRRWPSWSHAQLAGAKNGGLLSGSVLPSTYVFWEKLTRSKKRRRTPCWCKNCASALLNQSWLHKPIKEKLSAVTANCQLSSLLEKCLSKISLSCVSQIQLYRR